MHRSQVETFKTQRMTHVTMVTPEIPRGEDPSACVPEGGQPGGVLGTYNARKV